MYVSSKRSSIHHSLKEQQQQPRQEGGFERQLSAEWDTRLRIKSIPQ
jgi:hypothetical protein